MIETIRIVDRYTLDIVLRCPANEIDDVYKFLGEKASFGLLSTIMVYNKRCGRS
jgi:hypothetical protein